MCCGLYVSVCSSVSTSRCYIEPPEYNSITPIPLTKQVASLSLTNPRDALHHTKRQNCKRVTWSQPRLSRERYAIFLVTLDIAYICRKFDNSSLSYSWGMSCLGPWNLKWITWHDLAPFRDTLLSVGWDLLWSICIPTVKCLRLAATKISILVWAT